MVKDGITILIGGLRKEERVKSYDQVPVLGNIPLVGKIFKTGSNKLERTELLIMITPHIISGNEFTMGNDREFGDKPGKEYQEYESITPDKTMLPGNLPTQIDFKPYRDYLSYKGKTDGELTIKDQRYEYH